MLEGLGIIGFFNTLAYKIYRSSQFYISVTSKKGGYLPKVLVKYVLPKEELTDSYIYFEDLYTFEYYPNLRFRIGIINKDTRNILLKTYANFYIAHGTQSDGEPRLLHVASPLVVANTITLSPDELLIFHEESFEYTFSKADFLQACRTLDPKHFPADRKELTENLEVIDSIFIYSPVLALTYYFIDFILNPQNYTVEGKSGRGTHMAMKSLKGIREYLLFLVPSGDTGLILSKLSTLGGLTF